MTTAPRRVGRPSANTVEHEQFLAQLSQEFPYAKVAKMTKSGFSEEALEYLTSYVTMVEGSREVAQAEVDDFVKKVKPVTKSTVIRIRQRRL